MESLKIKDFEKNWRPSKSFRPNWSSDQSQSYLSKWRDVQRVSLDRD